MNCKNQAMRGIFGNNLDGICQYDDANNAQGPDDGDDDDDDDDEEEDEDATFCEDPKTAVCGLTIEMKGKNVHEFLWYRSN